MTRSTLHIRLYVRAPILYYLKHIQRCLGKLLAMLTVGLVIGFPWEVQIVMAKPPEPEFVFPVTTELPVMTDVPVTTELPDTAWWWTTPGGISQYDRGVMRGTIMIRIGWGQFPELPEGIEALSNDEFWGVVRQEWQVSGAVALRDCWRIGQHIWLHQIGGIWERFLVADCASKTDSRWQDGLSGYQWMVRCNVLAEVDGYTALRGGYHGLSAQGEILGDP